MGSTYRVSQYSLLALGALLLISCAPASRPQISDNDQVPSTEAEAFVEDENDEKIPEGSDQAPPLTAAEREELAQFVEPSLDEINRTFVLGNAAGVDPRHEIPSDLLARGLSFYQKNLDHISNKNYLTIVDFSKHSSRARMFILNMKTGLVTTLHVAHGKGSDYDNDGIANRFSNTPGSESSSIGYYRTAETYRGNHGISLRLDGLSATNSNVRERSIVVHGAAYVHDSNTKAGRSQGCLAVSMAEHSHVVSLLKQGSIIYAGISGSASN
jgi:hypothetical protein